jgi:putative Mn2+ efflux pump MntP
MKGIIVDNTKNGVPITFLLVSNHELFAIGLIASAVVTASYMIGKERQRKFLEKHSLIVLNKK